MAGPTITERVVKIETVLERVETGIERMANGIEKHLASQADEQKSIRTEIELLKDFRRKVVAWASVGAFLVTTGVHAAAKFLGG